MTQSPWIRRIGRISLLLVPGSLILGASCGATMRDAFLNGVGAFITNTVVEVLGAFIRLPVI